jgi:hypothetical protein
MRSALLVLFMGAVLGGCAFGDRQVSLTYKPLARPVPASGEVTVVTFRDERPRERLQDVGEVRNGFGMVTADVRIDRKGSVTGVGRWIADALAQELTAGGAHVRRVETEEEARGSAVIVTGAVTKLWINMYLQYDAKLRTTVRVTRAGSAPFEREVKGDKEGLAVFGTSSEYDRILCDLLRDWTGNAAPIVADHLGPADTPP